MTRRDRRWIQRAIRRPGALRSWVMRNRGRIRRAIGTDPVARDGTIKKSAVNKIIKAAKTGRLRVSGRTMRRLYLARTLMRLQRKRRKHKR